MGIMGIPGYVFINGSTFKSLFLISIAAVCLQDLKRFKTPTPPPPPSPKEVTKPDTFTVTQLLSLHEQVWHCNEAERKCYWIDN